VTIHAGLNLREALVEARRLGCTVEVVMRTGELVVAHPRWPRRERINGRRKSAPRRLTGLLMGLERAPGGPEGH
jgi:hypothetical protein